MKILSIVIAVFAFIEVLNVLILYFAPGSTKGNGLGVFNAYERAKGDPEIFALVQYLVNWVAGTKIIFIALLVGILIAGNTTTRILSMGALILSVSTFFWKLYPAIRKMDSEGQIKPSGYSKTLGTMIAVFLGFFTVALVVALTLQSGNG